MQPNSGKHPRIAILTSNDIRHRFFVNDLAETNNVTAVIYLSTGYHPANTDRENLDPRTAEILKHHFDERTRQEHTFFGHNSQFRQNTTSCAIRHLTSHDLNTAATVDFLAARNPDLVIVYGTTLIKPPLLTRFADRLINMHLGLSPYYRGTATNFYPLLNEEPHYVGATIHMIDAGIDTGPILHHATPEITTTDLPHTLGCKAILAGLEKVHQSIREFATGKLDPIPQWRPPNPRLYLRKDYHPNQVVQLYNLIEKGLFQKYVANKRDIPHPSLIP